VYHLLGEDQPLISDDCTHMTNMILLLETIILGGVATALVLLVHTVRRMA